MTTPGQATDKANTDATEAAITAAIEALTDARLANTILGEDGWPDRIRDAVREAVASEATLAVRAAAPVLMQAGRDQAHAEMRQEYAARNSRGSLVTPIAAMLGITADDIRELLAKGQITNATVVRRYVGPWEAVPDSHNTQEDA